MNSRVSMTGFFLFLVVGTILSVVVGVGATIVSSFFYIQFLFPMIMGIIVGFPLAFIVQKSRMHSPALVVIFSLVFTLLSYGVFSIGEYAVLQIIYRSDYQTGSATVVNPQETYATFDDYLHAQTGLDGMMAFFAMRTVARFEELPATLPDSYYQQNPQITYRYEPSYDEGSVLAFMAGEVFLLWLCLIYYPFTKARQPLCSQCGHAYDMQQTRLVGSCPSQRKLVNPLLKAMKAQQYNEMMSYLSPAEVPLPRLEVRAVKCQHCTNQETLVMIENVANGGGLGCVAGGLFGWLLMRKRELRHKYATYTLPDFEFKTFFEPKAQR